MQVYAIRRRWILRLVIPSNLQGNFLTAATASLPVLVFKKVVEDELARVLELSVSIARGSHLLEEIFLGGASGLPHDHDILALG